MEQMTRAVPNGRQTLAMVVKNVRTMIRRIQGLPGLDSF